jgi:hypothetical protein
VRANGFSYRIRYAANSGLREASTKGRCALKLTASKVVEGHQHLLQDIQRTAPLSWKMQLIVQHLYQRENPNFGKSVGPLELRVAHRDVVVSSPVVYRRLPDQRKLHHSFPLLDLVHVPEARASIFQIEKTCKKAKNYKTFGNLTVLNILKWHNNH